LLLTISDLLQRELGSVRFTVLTDNPEHIKEYTSKESDIDFYILKSRRRIPEIIREIATADLFIFGGGVPFFQQTRHLAVMSFLVGLCRIFKTPYMTWCVSSQPVSSRIAIRIFKWVLNGAASITVRDDHTVQLFKRCKARQEIVKVADPAFTFQSRNLETDISQLDRAGERFPDRPLIALTPRTLSGRDNKKENHYRMQSEEDYLREINCFAGVLDWCWENNFQSLFVPMNTYGPDDDRIAARLCMKIANYGDKALLIDEEIRPGVAPVIYGQCKASFVSRVHGSVTSVIGGCPVIMYAFQPKHTGIMEMIGLSEFSIDGDTASAEEVIHKLKTLLTQREVLIGKIDKELEGLRISARIPATIAKQIITTHSN
jgi:polysaccharide pyruvyl transferase WcaK-like protein